MVRVNDTRLGLEVLSETIDQAKVTKQGAEVAVESSSASNGRVNESRCTIEVIRATPKVAKVTKQGAEVAVASSPASTATVAESRIVLEVLSGTLKRAKVTKQGAEVAVASSLASSAEIAITRFGIEVLARRGPDLIIPIPVPIGADVLLHNWADEVKIEASYETSISISAHTGAEERRAILAKPERTLTFHWSRGGRVDVDRVFRFLRKMTETQCPIPLYCDAVEMTTTAIAGAGNDTIAIDTTQARFFGGARIGILHLDNALDITTFEFYEILLKTSTSITFTTPLLTDIAVGDVVVPMIDCEIVLEPMIEEAHGELVEVTLSVLEVAGASQLPATSTGDPDGFVIYQGYPIFNIDPNYANIAEHGYNRQGDIYRRGRKTVVYITADRARGAETYEITVDRTDAFKLIRFFDSRRGRCRTFFQIDQEYLWIVQSATGVFIEIDKLGDFLDFQVGLNPGWVGFILEDGTAIVREVVTTQDLPSSWRITVADALPVIDLTQLVRFTRARKVRLNDDTMEENWTTTGVFETSWRTIEALDELEETT